ncbi:MAG: DUF362 domain-containing protein [Bacteroidales bacterium]
MFRKMHHFINRRNFMNISFLAAGLVSTLWFLLRVVPKPQRAAYPCMQAAAPMMSGFIVWVISLAGTVTLFRNVKLNFQKSRYLAGSLILTAAIAGLMFIQGIPSDKASARGSADWIITPNQPVGVGQGIHPGRVVWVHDPAVTSWDGKTGNWWDEQVCSQVESDKMIRQSLLSLTGAKNEKKAWTALFKSFNQKHNRSKTGYQPGEKIAVKINTNNTYGHENSPEINATPQMVLALLKSLVNEAGIPQEKITVFDASRFITDNIFEKCHAAFPGVIFVDNIGGDGRVKSTYKDGAIPYSTDNGKLATGLATCAVEADYLINMALLKGHVGQGVTLCAKNYYGVTSIYNDWRKNAHNNFDPDRNGRPKYLTFVDFLAHKDLGNKTMLFLIDGVYGCKLVNGPPGPKWQMAPFSNNWGCSLLASQDPVAIDAVGLDLLRSEWPDAPDMAFSDQYLFEAALIGNPPSKSVYDPQRTGEKFSSLGVMEHWNNVTGMKYSRNLGKKEGIELVQVGV